MKYATGLLKYLKRVRCVIPDLNIANNLKFAQKLTLNERSLGKVLERLPGKVDGEFVGTCKV